MSNSNGRFRFDTPSTSGTAGECRWALQPHQVLTESAQLKRHTDVESVAGEGVSFELLESAESLAGERVERAETICWEPTLLLWGLGHF